jgi:hypothetical protein
MAENKMCHFGNKCNKGPKCPFIHPEPGNISSSSPKPKKQCRFGVQCKKIPNCPFDHSPSTVDSLASTIEKLTIVIKLTSSLFL